jgi:hypothetical protein
MSINLPKIAKAALDELRGNNEPTKEEDETETSENSEA